MYKNWTTRLEVIRKLRWYEMGSVLDETDRLLNLFMTDCHEFAKQPELYFLSCKNKLFDLNLKFPKKGIYSRDFDCNIIYIQKSYIDFKMINEKILKNEHHDQIDDFIKTRNSIRDKALYLLHKLIIQLIKDGDDALFYRWDFEIHFEIEWVKGFGTSSRNTVL